MTEIPKEELHKYFGKEILMKENGNIKKVVFDKIRGGWIQGYCSSSCSFIQVIMDGNQSEFSAKYFIE